MNKIAGAVTIGGMRALAVLVVSLCTPAFADERFDAAITEMKRDPKIVAAAFSAYVCSFKADRDAAIVEIATERKYARVGGAIDVGKMHEMQNQIREADEAVTAARAYMRRVKMSLLPCKGTVLRLSECIRDDPDEAAKCGSPEMRALERVERELLSEALSK